MLPSTRKPAALVVASLPLPDPRAHAVALLRARFGLSPAHAKIVAELAQLGPQTERSFTSEGAR